MKTIKELQARRNELVEAIIDLDPVASTVEIFELHEEISNLDREIHAIDPSKV